MSNEHTPEKQAVCEQCLGTGYYGDHCAGIKGNSEYVVCECQGRQSEGQQEKLVASLSAEIVKLRAEKAELLAAAREFYTAGATIMTGNEHTEDEHFRAIQARDALRATLARHANVRTNFAARG